MRLGSHWLPLLAALGTAVFLMLPDERAEHAALAAVEAQGPTAEPGFLGAEAMVAPGVGGLIPALAVTAARPREGLKDAVVTVFSGTEHLRVGVPVRISDPGAPRPVRHALTDAKGRVHLMGVPLDGTVLVEALRVVGTARIDSADVQLFCAAGTPVTIRTFDAVSAGEVHTSAKAVPQPTQSPSPGAIGVRTVGVLPGDRQKVGLGLLERELSEHRYVAWEERSWWTTVSRYADRIEIVYPLRREARVQVYAEEYDGTPTERAQVEGFKIAGRHITEDMRAVPHRGGFLLHGVPFFREEALEVLVVRPPREVSEVEEFEEIEEICIEFEEEDKDLVEDDFLFPDVYEGAAIGRGRLPREWARLLVVTATFPKNEDEIVLFGGSGGSYTCRSSCCSGRRAATGRVQVTVLRRSGAPAVGALVRVGIRRARTDFRGRAVVETIRVGEHTVRLQESGLVPSTREVTVRADRTSRVDLREEAGATVKIRVVDAQGEGLPFAILAVPRNAGWVDLRNETGSEAVQRVDPFTDGKGRRTLRRFPAGTWKFQASYGSREGTAEVRLTHGATETVTITVK